MKECRSCKIEKNDDEFYKKKSNRDGLYSYCIECSLKKNRITREKNLENHLRCNRKYRVENREILNEKAKIYYQENKESCLIRSKLYREKNKSKISKREAIKRLSDPDRFVKNKEKHYQWAKNNRNRLNQYQKDWYQKNKEKRKAHVVLFRAIKKGKIMRPEACIECKKICKPDGHHEDYNKPLDVVWICRACHSRKSPRTVIK